MKVLEPLPVTLGVADDEIAILLEALARLRRGDATVRLPVHWVGLPGKVADAFNDVVLQNAQMAAELARLRHVVGKEGKLKQRATLPQAHGFWAESIESINALIDDLVHPTSEVARVIGAVAQGDLSKSMALEVDGRELEGEFLRTARTINKMVEQLGDFSAEVTRVAREVGTEGKLGGQATLKGVAGTWKDLTDSVNSMAGNLTDQVRNIADVTTAVAKGDLSKKIEVDVKGEFLTLKNTINTMVDQLRSFASEVTRVAREVGTEGSLGGQARVEGASGTWKDLTDSVNSMAGNLTSQVRNIADVTKAVAAGDLSKKITVDVKGEILELKNTVNTMVDQLRSFAAEVTRVAREVGTEGKLGGQADVQGVAGTWKDLTDSVNLMASNLTSQVRNIADVTKAVAAGDLSKKITVDVKGEISELKNTINTMVDQLSSFAAEVTRVAREVGTEGKLGGQADVQGAAGTWKDLTESVNFMAGNLTSQVRNIAEVTTAVAAGDLSKKITVDVKGEISELKNTINTMVDQLRSFAAEVTRVAREVGTEGKLGGQADVQGVAGTWKDLTDSVNLMASNLTSQVRGIAKVVTAVADGDLKQKLTVEAKGEIAALADTINGMTDTLATFADQVTTVAREVGVDGKLGGQAKVPGAAGTWKGLTENVNQLAANLTTQVRAIAEVATAVTQGDLTRSITVEAQGEVAALKDTINEMIVNLKDTTQKNTEQDWLKTNLAKFSRMLQGQKDLLTVGQLILSELAPVVGAQQAEFYVLTSAGAGAPPRLKLFASYASAGHDQHGKELGLGEGLIGQCAVERTKILLTAVPSATFRIATGLSENAALDVLVLPVVFEGEVRGVLELASLQRFNPTHQAFLDQLTESIGIVINTIAANTRTEDLLAQSQSLAQELQNRQQELQQTNEELQEKARLLVHQNQEVERKNAEVEQARQALEEKAEQLALTSKYKSEFLANMSHELRTPLNSLLILSDQLCKNSDGNLTPRQVEFAKTIHLSGNDLLMLINDILDLSKIESGTVAVEVSEMRIDDLQRSVERSFRHVAESKHLDFGIIVEPAMPATVATDVQRLQQVMKNLLSNAFKFTHQGSVVLTIGVADGGWSRDSEELNRAGQVLAFSVADTGIGISPAKQQIIFEAFQQADGSTSRKYGGTGLGLAISRELARLLGGEIRLVSTPGRGSTFTLYLPQSYSPVRGPRHARGEAAPRPPAPTLEREPATESSRPAAAPVDDAGEAGDDRHAIDAGDDVVLVVENDPAFADVLLQAARAEAMSTVPVSTADGDAADWRASILIVDDQPGTLLIFDSVLQELGQNLVFAGSGRDALRQVLEHDFAVILLDVNMPDLDGFETAELIRSHRRSAHTPIIFITAYADEAQMSRGYALGAVDYILSPFVPAVLRSKVGVFVQLHMMQRQIRRQADDRAAMRSAETARMLAELQHRRSAFLSRASRVLGGSLDPDVGARELALLALQAPASCAAVLLADEGVDGSACVASAAPDGTPRIEQLGLDRLPAAMAAALRAAFQRRAAVDEAGVAAWPLMSGDALLGVLAAGAVDGVALDKPLLDDLVERAGAAFQNARLYRSLQHEIVERRAAERELQVAGRRKDEFLAMLSHELRNPLAAACSALELLRRLGPLEPRLQQATGVMGRQLGQMTRLIEELLDVARINHDKIVLVRESVDLKTVIAHSIESVQGLLELREQTLVLQLPEEPVWINGDPARLAQIVSNLLHNASKYSPSRMPIELRCVVDAGGALISVLDQGQGIDADLLPHVFDMFAQGQHGLDRGQGGLGVGLTLAMRLAQLHGGRIEAFSEGPGRGSEFRLRLPCLWLAHSEAGGTQALPHETEASPSHGRRVVVIDDNADAADGIAALLELAGHRVRTAGDGLTGLAASVEFRAEVVIIDVGLPLLNGHEVARRLRSTPGQGPQLLIALTGYGQATDRAAALDAGFDGHFVKPVDPDELMRCIAQWTVHAPAEQADHGA